MAIIIPSKKIYEIRNPKVPENALKQVDISQNVVRLETRNENLSTILSGTSGGDNGIGYIRLNTTDGNTPSENLPSPSQYRYISACQVASSKWSASHTLSRTQDKINFYISNVNPSLETIYEATVEKGTAISYPSLVPSNSYRIEFVASGSGTYNYRSKNINGIYTDFEQSLARKITENSYSFDSKTDIGITIAENGVSASFATFFKDSNQNFLPRYSKTILLGLDDINYGLGGTYFPANISTSYTTDNITFNVNALSKLTIYVGFDLESLVGIGENAYSRTIECLKITMELKEAKLIFGESISSIESKGTQNMSLTNSGNGEVVFSTGNDLIRDKNTYQGASTEYLYTQTLEAYKNGKETATIKCSIGEYYDKSGNLVISTKTPNKMLFEHYDKVVPMVRSASGADVPMSVNSEGKAKVFDVVGVREIYDGGILQELTLREHSAVEIPQTTYQTYVNKGGGLTYEIISSQVVTEINSAGGITYIIGE